jgi:hypothetical protein
MARRRLVDAARLLRCDGVRSERMLWEALRGRDLASGPLSPSTALRGRGGMGGEGFTSGRARPARGRHRAT